MVKSGKKWEKVGKSGKKWEKWGKVVKSWNKLEWKSGKWPPAAILDAQKSLSIAFLAISDQYATFIFLNFVQNGRRPPFWKSLLGHFG